MNRIPRLTKNSPIRGYDNDPENDDDIYDSLEETCEAAEEWREDREDWSEREER